VDFHHLVIAHAGRTAKTAPNALRMPELFFYKFLRLLQRCHGSTAAEYEKYERAEIKIRR